MLFLLFCESKCFFSFGVRAFCYMTDFLCLKNAFVCCSRCGLFGVTVFSLCVVTDLVIVTLRSVLCDSLFVVS